MAVKVIIPTPLRPYAGKRDHVDVAANTVGEALGTLIAEHGDLRRHLYQDDGRLRSFVNVYVNDDDIRYLQKEATPLRDGDTISIVPSIAGGSTGNHACAPLFHRELNSRKRPSC
jgi:molybdopterin converting factor small subunit